MSDTATAQHTPGPWAASAMRHNFGRVITLESHLRRPYGASVDPVQCRDTYMFSIATANEHSCHISRAESDANACLIAAAPEMYALLQRLAEHFMDTDAPLGLAAAALLERLDGGKERL